VTDEEEVLVQTLGGRCWCRMACVSLVTVAILFLSSKIIAWRSGGGEGIEGVLVKLEVELGSVSVSIAMGIGWL